MKNKKLKNLIKLGSKVSIYVPSTIDINKDFDNKIIVDKTLSLLSEKFGGATSTKAIGCWVTNSKDLVKEQVTLCYAYTDSITLEKEINNIIDYCLKLKKELKQEAISLEINNELYFI